MKKVGDYTYPEFTSLKSIKWDRIWVNPKSKEQSRIFLFPKYFIEHEDEILDEKEDHPVKKLIPLYLGLHTPTGRLVQIFHVVLVLNQPFCK